MRIYAKIEGNICTGILWATDQEAQAGGFVRAEPWHVVGENVVDSLAAYIAAQEAEAAAAAALRARLEADFAELAALKADPNLQQLLDMTPAAVQAAINAQFADPGQRTVLLRIALVAQAALRLWVRS